MTELTAALSARHSTRAMSDRPVERAKIDALIEAFRWGPSSNNRQPWRLLLVESAPARERWDATLSAGNAQWAPRAAVKIVVLGNPADQPELFGQQRYLLDVGLALNGLLVQANAMGLAVRAMAGFDEAQARAAFAVPDPWRVVAMVAAGYPGRLEDCHPDVQAKETRARTRKTTAEIASIDKFPL